MVEVGYGRGRVGSESRDGLFTLVISARCLSQ